MLGKVARLKSRLFVIVGVSLASSAVVFVVMNMRLPLIGEGRAEGVLTATSTAVPTVTATRTAAAVEVLSAKPTATLIPAVIKTPVFVRPTKSPTQVFRRRTATPPQAQKPTSSAKEPVLVTLTAGHILALDRSPVGYIKKVVFRLTTADGISRATISSGVGEHCTAVINADGSRIIQPSLTTIDTTAVTVEIDLFDVKPREKQLLGIFFRDGTTIMVTIPEYLAEK